MDHNPALAAAAGNHLVDAVGRQRPAVVGPEPQRAPPRLGMTGPYPDIPVQGAGCVMGDLDNPHLAALPADGDLPLPQVHIAGLQVVRVISDPGQLGGADAGDLEHGEDRGISPLVDAAALAGLRQLR